MASRIFPPPDAPETRMPASSGASTSFDHSSALKSAFVDIVSSSVASGQGTLGTHGLPARTARAHLATARPVLAVAVRRSPEPRVRQLGGAADRLLHPAL